jgi:hypothetical protein
MSLNNEKQDLVDEFLDDEQIVDAAFQLGRQMESVTDDKGQLKIKKSQINGFFESLCMARRFSDIEAFIMRKVGQDRWPRQVGEEALSQLNALKEAGNKIGTDPRSRLFAKLALARAWARLVASEFFFRRGK